jgi:hypothetical protein
MIKNIEEAWARWNTVSGLLIDVKEAFPNVANENLIKRIEDGDLMPICAGGWKVLCQTENQS